MSFRPESWNPGRTRRFLECVARRGFYEPQQTTFWLLFIVFALALTLRTMLYVQYYRHPRFDDGLHYLASFNALHGVLPYRDFAFLHPPGIVEFLLPFVFVGRWLGHHEALSVARLSVVAIGVLNVLLVTKIALTCQRSAALIAGLLAACYSQSLITDRQIWLEPILSAFCLAGAVLLPRVITSGSLRHAIYAGLLFGAGSSVKIWGFFYVGGAVLWLVWNRAFRKAIAIAGAALLMWITLVLPFAFFAPHAFLYDVFFVHNARPADGLVSRAGRFSSVLGFDPTRGAQLPTPILVVAAIVLAALLIVVSRASRIGQFWTLMTVVIAVAFLISPTFYLHYADFAGPPLAIVAGISLSDLMRRLRKQRFLFLCIPGLFTLLLIGQAAQGIRVAWREQPVPRDLGSIRSTKCLWVSRPGLALAASWFNPIRRDCRYWIDPYGEGIISLLKHHQRAEFSRHNFRALGPWQMQLRQQLAQASAAVIETNKVTQQWSRATEEYFGLNFVRVGGDSQIQIWRRASRDP